METYKGTVISVNPERFTATIRIDSTRKVLTDIPLTPLFSSPLEGACFIPPSGAKVYVCFPDDHSFPFICGYANEISVTEGHYRQSLPIMDEGDFYLQTDAAQFIISREGAIALKTGSLAQLYLTPYESRFAVFGKNIELHSPAGHIQLLTRSDKSSGDKTPVLTHIEFRQYAEDDSVIEIEFGTTEDFGDQKIFGFSFKGLNITIDEEGNLSIQTDKKITVNSKDNIELISDKTIKLKANELDAKEIATLKLGGDSDNAVLFSKFKELLGLIIDGFINNSASIGANSGGPVALTAPLSNLIQAKAKLEGLLPEDIKVKL